MARSAARIAVIGAAICVFFLLTLSLWNLAAAKWQHERNPVSGNFYTVEELQMHIDCSGTGSPRSCWRLLLALRGRNGERFSRSIRGSHRFVPMIARDMAGAGHAEEREMQKRLFENCIRCSIRRE